MKLIRVGLTAKDMLTLLHKQVTISSSGPMIVGAGEEPDTTSYLESVSAGEVLHGSAHNRQLVLSPAIPRSGSTTGPTWLSVRTSSPHTKMSIRLGTESESAHNYTGKILIGAAGNLIRVMIELDLDQYVKGVLSGEMPASYELEALKAQAVAARTYGLRPRVDHTSDFVNVCNSYLCCQCFAPDSAQAEGKYLEAIDATKSQILTYNDEPILALFSSTAGGHTENYENCFSDLKTNQFPAPSLPYLKGVPEGELPKFATTESLIASLWQGDLGTVDQWSPHFKWHVHLTGDHLESAMHHTIELMLNDPDQAPFVVPPAGAIFGQIKSFKVSQRGVAGTAMQLDIDTTKGLWSVRKELVIRNVFKNAGINLHRLASARFYLKHAHDSQGFLSDLEIFGLGWGHGVGLQQTGAQGWAKRRHNYQAILSHYFPGSEVSTA